MRTNFSFRIGWAAALSIAIETIVFVPIALLLLRYIKQAQGQ